MWKLSYKSSLGFIQVRLLSERDISPVLVSNLNLPCLIEGNVSNKKEVVEKWMGKLGLSSWSQVAYMGKYPSSQNCMVLPLPFGRCMLYTELCLTSGGFLQPLYLFFWLLSQPLLLIALGGGFLHSVPIIWTLLEWIVRPSSTQWVISATCSVCVCVCVYVDIDGEMESPAKIPAK